MRSDKDKGTLGISQGSGIWTGTNILFIKKEKRKTDKSSNHMILVHCDM